ncbi:MAG: hypothetical protein M1817_002035 [Caeruleum heppii]|nr:MAG: hypothetical protein M1817_002035 [Caeruleum heppii]
MYLPRSLISHLYLHLLRTHHPLSTPVLILVALEPDALCACRILTALLKRDYIPHTIHPVSGYGDLAMAGEQLVRPMRTTEGGNGGVVVCLGVGGLIDLSSLLGLEAESEGEDATGGVEVWLVDARRPWYLGNVFGGAKITGRIADADAARGAPGVEKGEIQRSYKPGQGGIIVFDDGDIEDELRREQEAYCAIEQMPELDDEGDDIASSEDESDTEPSLKDQSHGKKRKSWSDREEDEDESEDEDGRPRQRRRSNSSGSIPSSPARPHPRGLLTTNTLHRSASSSRTSSPPAKANDSLTQERQPSARTLRHRLLRLRRQHGAVLRKYEELGASYSEPVSSLMYSLASELGREDNDLLWLAIVGIGSLELYGRGMVGVGITHTANNELGGSAGWGGERGERIRQILRDEVRRLNPPELADTGRDGNRGEGQGIIPTYARSPTDMAIRLSPEPRFLLVRHWSLYDSMLHSPYLSARLHIWSDAGRRRLHKLLAKMGVSLTQCKQSYTHMDVELKRGLRQRLLKYAPVYGLDGLVPPEANVGRGREGWGFVRNWGFKACLSATDVGVVVGAILEVGKAGVAGLEGALWDTGREPRDPVDEEGRAEGEEWVGRFWQAYDALQNVDALKAALPTAMHLHRAILRTGTSLMEKRQIKPLKAFRIGVVKEGPDVRLFTHPSALTKLALWIGEAMAEQDKDLMGKLGKGGRGTPLVMASLNERRGVYVVVGTGGGGGMVDLVGQKERKAKREKRRQEKAEKAAEKEKKRKERDERAGSINGGESSSEEEEDSSSSSESEDDERSHRRGHGRNRFGNAFQEAIVKTKCRVRVDSFEHCVVEVKKEDLVQFLESVSMRAVVG